MAEEEQEELLVVDDNQDENKETTEESLSNDEKKDDSTEDENEKKPKKKINIKIILIILISLLTTMLIAIFAYYFMQDAPIEEKMMKEKIKEKPVELSFSDFKFENKDFNKLNKRLKLLTKENIIEEEPIKPNNKIDEEEIDEKKKKIEEEKRILETKKMEFERQKLEIEKIKKETIALKNKIEVNKKELEEEKQKIQQKDEELTSQKEFFEIQKEAILTMKNEEEGFYVTLISAAKIKGVLYKSYFDKVIKIDKNIQLCRDTENNIELIYGPFDEENKKDLLLENLVNNGFTEAYSFEITNKAYNKRCNY